MMVSNSGTHTEGGTGEQLSGSTAAEKESEDCSEKPAELQSETLMPEVDLIKFWVERHPHRVNPVPILFSRLTHFCRHNVVFFQIEKYVEKRTRTLLGIENIIDFTLV